MIHYKYTDEGSGSDVSVYAKAIVSHSCKVCLNNLFLYNMDKLNSIEGLNGQEERLALKVSVTKLPVKCECTDCDEDNFQLRAKFLKENGRTEGDVMEDQLGEYFLADNDKDESEPFSKVYLMPFN